MDIMRHCLLILLLYVLSFPAATIELPDIGISANTVMSPADEQELGAHFFRQLRRQVAIVDDAQINNYLNTLGNRLVSYSHNPEQRFHFFVINESSINAFAVPGGFIGIHSGLILKTHSESELASVLAHEISHVTQRHIARIIQKSQRFSLPAMAALIAALVIAGTGDPEVGQAAVTAVIAGNVQLQINFTRIHETEADHIGMQLLAKAGFEPRDMPSFFERLQAASRYYEGGVPEFLRTHPVTTNRIAEARDRAEQYPHQKISYTPLYHLMKAKLLSLTTDNKQSLHKKLTEMLQTGRYRDECATRYALALTLLAIRKIDDIETHIQWLFKNDADRVIYHLLKANVAILQKQYTKAIKIYEHALKIYPRNKMLGMAYAEQLLHNNNATKAKLMLLQIPSLSNPYYYHLLANAYQSTGEIAMAHLTLADRYYLIGETRQALIQIKQAQKHKNLNFYLTARIETRYKELQTELFEAQKSLQQ